MLQAQVNHWKSLFLSLIYLVTLTSSSVIPNIAREDEPWSNGPYALRLRSPTSNPALSNAFFTSDRSFTQNPPPSSLQPIWAGRSYGSSLRPNSTDNLYIDPGAIFLDARLDNRLSPQLTLLYAKRGNEEVPYKRWVWDSGPGVTHYWPGTYYVSWGGFRFVKRGERTLLFEGDGTSLNWKIAAEYFEYSASWQVVHWNATDTTKELPANLELVDVEVVPFGEVGTVGTVEV